MPSGNRNIFFSHFSCTPARTCVNGRYAPEFREVLKITANYLWQSVPGHKCVLTSPFDCFNFRLAMYMSSTATFRFLIFVPCIRLRNLRNLQSVSASLLGRFARFLLSALRANKICNLRSFRRMDFSFGKIMYPNHMTRELSGRTCCV